MDCYGIFSKQRIRILLPFLCIRVHVWPGFAALLHGPRENGGGKGGELIDVVVKQLIPISINASPIIIRSSTYHTILSRLVGYGNTGYFLYFKVFFAIVPDPDGSGFSR